jgi:hypothetical protein
MARSGSASSIARLIARELRWGNRLKDPPKPPCVRCEGHGCVTVYSISDEYDAPCPACKGAEAYHARIERKEGCIPTELRWPALKSTAAKEGGAK